MAAFTEISIDDKNEDKTDESTENSPLLKVTSNSASLVSGSAKFVHPKAVVYKKTANGHRGLCCPGTSTTINTKSEIKSDELKDPSAGIASSSEPNLDRITPEGDYRPVSILDSQRNGTVLTLDHQKVASLSERLTAIMNTVRKTANQNSLKWMFSPEVLQHPPPMADNCRYVYYKIIESLRDIYPEEAVKYFSQRLWFLVSDDKESSKIKSHLIVFWRSVQCYIIDEMALNGILHRVNLSDIIFKLLEDTLCRPELKVFSATILEFIQSNRTLEILESVFTTNSVDRSLEIASKENEVRVAYRSFVRRLKISHSDGSIEDFCNRFYSRFFGETVQNDYVILNFRRNLINFWSAVHCLLEDFVPGEADIDERLLEKISRELEKVVMDDAGEEQPSQVINQLDCESSKPVAESSGSVTSKDDQDLEDRHCATPMVERQMEDSISTSRAAQSGLRNEPCIQVEIEDISSVLEEIIKHLNAIKSRKNIKEMFCNKNPFDLWFTKDPGSNAYKQFILFLNSSQSEAAVNAFCDRIDGVVSETMETEIAYTILLVFWTRIHWLIKDTLLPKTADCDEALLMKIFNLLQESSNLSSSLRLVLQIFKKMEWNCDPLEIFEKENILQRPSEKNTKRLAYHEFIKNLNELFSQRDVENFCDKIHCNIGREQNMVIRRTHSFIFWTRVHCLRKDKVSSGEAEFEKETMTKIKQLVEETFKEAQHLNLIPEKLRTSKEKNSRERDSITSDNRIILSQLIHFMFIDFLQSRHFDDSTKSFWDWIKEEPKEIQAEFALTLFVFFWAKVHCLVEVNSQIDESITDPNDAFHFKDDPNFHEELLQEIMEIMEDTFNGNSCAARFNYSAANCPGLNLALEPACFFRKCYYKYLFRKSVWWRRKSRKCMSAIDCFVYIISLFVALVIVVVSPIVSLIIIYNQVKE